jgi:hypothetical protein
MSPNRLGGDNRSMDSPNLDLVRSIYAGWERGDFSSAEWADREIEFVIDGGPTAGSWTGVAGMAEHFRSFLSAWEGLRLEVDEYRELDCDASSCSCTSAGAAR